MPNRIKLPDFLRTQPRLAIFALLATFCSGFGQTFFVSVFGEQLRTAHDISHTVYGSLYAGATLIGGLLLLRGGVYIDRWPLHRVTTASVLILALGCLLTGLAWHSLVLGLGFVLIRLGGQGMMGQLGLTVAGRYFGAHRGKAVALAALGFPLSESVLPAAAVFLMAWYSLASAWIAAALLLVLILLPLLHMLSRNAARPQHAASDSEDGGHVIHYSRSQTLRDPAFYLFIPALLMAPFTVTGILFHQSAIAEARGWSLNLVASAFTAFAIGHLLPLLSAGPVVDRFGARRCLPLALLPMVAGLFLLAAGNADWVVFAYMGLTGMSLGLISIIGGALWPERYGTRHLGAIRSLAQTVMILSTAIAPVLLGALLDYGISVSVLASVLAITAILASLLAATVR